MQTRKFSVIGSRWGTAVAAVALAIGLGAAAAPKAAGPAGLVKVRFGGDATTTRVVVELSRASQAKLISAGQPVVIDLSHIDVGAEREGRGQGLVRAWTADGAPGSARLKLELTRSAKIERRFMLAPTEGAPNYRYVIDLRADGAAAPAARPARSTNSPLIPRVYPVTFAKVAVPPGSSAALSGARAASSAAVEAESLPSKQLWL